MKSIPAILKILVLFALVLFLNRLRFHLSVSLFVGSLILALWMGLQPVQWLGIIVSTAGQMQTVSLLLVVALILVMSRIMKETGHMDRLVGSFARLSRDARMVGSVMTALIGLLPMPGGALFSAPMVESSLANHSVSKEQKTVLNYWFRHVWEYWWPLYPGVVLAVALLGVETWRYMVVMAPMTLLSVLSGTFFLIRPIKKRDNPGSEGFSWGGVRTFLWEIMPILVVVFVILGLALLNAILGALGLRVTVPGTISIIPGLAVAMVWVCRINRVSFGRFGSAVLDKNLLPMLFLLLAIMVFKETMIEGRAVLQIRNELMAYHIPVILVVMIMPFISGLITGLAIGFVGTSFPLIIPMFPSAPLLDYLSYAALAYSFGYMGMMLSPVHLCLLVTKDYYHASLMRSYRLLFMPALMIMVIVPVLFSVIRVL
ncbi:MAG: DUF401 family protein [Desulfatiglandales bacterium]